MAVESGVVVRRAARRTRSAHPGWGARRAARAAARQNAAFA